MRQEKSFLRFAGLLRGTATGIRSQPLRREISLICLQIGRFWVRGGPLSGGRQPPSIGVDCGATVAHDGSRWFACFRRAAYERQQEISTASCDETRASASRLGLPSSASKRPAWPTVVRRGSARSRCVSGRLTLATARLFDQPRNEAGDLPRTHVLQQDGRLEVGQRVLVERRSILATSLVPEAAFARSLVALDSISRVAIERQRRARLHARRAPRQCDEPPWPIGPRPASGTTPIAARRSRRGS